MKQSLVLRGTCMLLLAAMTLLPLTAVAADQQMADDGSSLLARGGSGSGGGGRGGFGAGDGTGTGTGPKDGSGNGAKTGDCVNS